MNKPENFPAPGAPYIAAGTFRRDMGQGLQEDLELRIAQLEDELEQHRHDLHVQRTELRRVRREAADAAHQVERIRNTISYRLGNALIRCKTPRGILSLPRELVALVTDSNERRRLKRTKGDQARRWSDLLDGAPEPVEEALAYAAAQRLPPRETAQLLVDLAKARRTFDIAGAIELGRASLDYDRRAFRLRWLAQLMQDAGMIAEPADLAREALRSRDVFSASAVNRLKVMAGLDRARHGIPVPARRGYATFQTQPGVVAYVAASSLPHQISGYTMRTHSLLRSLRAAGWDVRAMTRVGYPWDRSDAKEIDGGRTTYEVDDVRYERLRGPNASETPVDVYVAKAAKILAAQYVAAGACVAHAASNYMNGLPALIAARQVGIPFVYEVRGLWELTSAAKNQDWEKTENFALQRDLEALVAREADAVLVLTEGLRQELIERGVEADRIALAPNCVDTEAFEPRERDEALTARLGLTDRYVIGFLGSLVDYEGLDNLLEASALAVEDGLDVALLVVGDGKAAEHLRQQARDLHMEDRLVMTGRVPPGDIPAYYAQIDVAAFPRKPFRVCELVSPLKPLEAMAMTKPVIASDVGAIAEFVRHEQNGLLFAKGDVASLKAAILRMASSPKLAERLALNGRAWVERERTWSVTAGNISRVYARVAPHAVGGRVAAAE